MAVSRAGFATLLLLLIPSVGCALAAPEDDFWKWFGRNEETLFNFERDQERTFDQLITELRKVDPKLTFEFGPPQGGRREFVISADGVRAAFQKVESLFAAAPTLPKWKFTKFRPRREPVDLQYRGVVISASSVSVRLEPDGPKAGLTVLIPGYTKAAHRTYLTLAFLFLDQTLGEYDVGTRVGFVEVNAPSSVPARDAHGLHELPAAFDRFFFKR